MKLGLFNLNMGACADPETAVAVARAAEAAGFESLPQRNPLVLAKELASLDHVSRGRLIFGVGVGYLKPEFDALGIPFAHKGARTEDSLQAMLAIWTQEKPQHQGRFTSFAGVQAFPRPLQKPHPPIVFGGHTPEAFRRAIMHASGWYGFFQDVDGAARCVAGLQQAARELGRSSGLDGFEVSITPAGPLDLDTARRFADAGVHRLIPFRLGGNAQDQLDFVAQTADTLVGRL